MLVLLLHGMVGWCRLTKWFLYSPFFWITQFDRSPLLGWMMPLLWTGFWFGHQLQQQHYYLEHFYTYSRGGLMKAMVVWKELVTWNVKSAASSDISVTYWGMKTKCPSTRPSQTGGFVAPFSSEVPRGPFVTPLCGSDFFVMVALAAWAQIGRTSVLNLTLPCKPVLQ